MAVDRAFDKEYSINVARLSLGKNEERFEIGPAFFEHFPYSPIKVGELEVLLSITKYNTHLDVNFHMSGWLQLSCDRCTQAYQQPVSGSNRIIFSFDEDLDFEGYEVMYVNRNEPHLVITQELYDFIQLLTPIRKVPKKKIHLCPPEVLALLGLDTQGVPLSKKASPSEEEDIDPRWAALRKLKDDPSQS